MSKLDTEDWRLSVFAEYVPLKAPYQITCPSCIGRGEVGGGFKDIDGPRECPQCYGRKFITHPGPDTQKPEIPVEFIKHMRKAMKEYEDN